MHKIDFGSPTKENYGGPATGSPSKRKRAQGLSQLINFIKSSGLIPPPHVKKIISGTINPESPLKPSTNNHNDLISESDSKKLKIQLADSLFQLKKIEEDFADFKRTTKLQREKDIKKYEQNLSKLKNQLQLSNEDNTYVVERMKKERQNEVKAIREKAKMEFEQEINKLNEAYKIKLQSEEKLRKREVAQLQRNTDRKYVEREKLYDEQMTKITHKHSNEIKQLNLKHRLVIQQKEKRYESTYLALQSERKTEEKLHEKTKIDTNKEKEKLLSDLYFERNVKRQHEEDIENKQKDIKKLKSQIKDLQILIQLKEEKYKKNINQIEIKYQTKYAEYEQNENEKVKIILADHTIQLKKYQQQLTHLEYIHQEKESIIMANLEELSGSFQKRPSKREDINQIDKLKWSLTKRQEEVNKLRQDLKHTNLELENKQDIYTRIFRGSSMSREKKTHPKQDREQMIIEEKLNKQTIFRKSQTADLKYLLKVYNNTKFS